MKREINCKKHGESWAKTLTSRATPPHPGERLMVKVGTAKADFMCDGCGESLPHGSVVWAVSIWVENGPNPYWAWESEFIDVLNEKQLDAIERLDADDGPKTEQGPG